MSELVPLGELATIVSGATPKTEVKAYWNGTIPWITPADLTNWHTPYFKGQVRKITEAGLKNCSARLLPEGAILFSSRAPIGHCAIVTTPLCTNQGFKSLIPNPRLNSLFGYYALRHFTPTIVALGRGATFAEITKEIIEDVQIPLPPLSEQRRIAALLERADHLRRTRRFARQMSDTFLQSVFLQMFGDPVTNPLGWEKHKLGELCRIRRGASPRPIDDFLGGTVPWIKIGDGTKGSDLYIASTRDFVTQAGADKSVFLEAGSLIFANCGVSLGFARILKISGCIHDGWLSFDQLHESVNTTFLLKTLNQITPYLRALAPDGTQPNLNTEIMKELPIIVPPLSLQERYIEIVQRFERLRAGQMEAERQAEHLFQTLLHRAFAV